MARFSLSHQVNTTFDMGELVPIGLVEVVPGDVFRHSTSALIRLTPMLTPVMSKVEVAIHHWFVPNRLSWVSWENFITGGQDGLNASVFPTITLSSVAVGSLANYLGLPVSGGALTTSALPFRGYNRIFNECYRDQDLIASVGLSTADGNDTTTGTSLQNRAWEKDYFTSARPWEQKGPTVTLPISGTAPIKGLGLTGSPTNTGSFVVRESAPLPNRSYAASMTPGGSSGFIVESDFGPGAANAKPLVYADLSTATGVPVNMLREALAIQRFEEFNARYGSRYTEYLLHQFNVRSSDARLQRPEYLGGGKQLIQFSEVLQTAEGTNPVGTLRGHGIGAMRSNRYMKRFEEHGYVFTLISMKPRTMYYQGLRRTWNRRTKFDYLQPQLQNIGQQKILNKEIYAAAASPDGTWGFQDRYDEYRRQESTVSGEQATTLNTWHMGREFASEPALNGTFVASNPTERIFAIPATDNVICTVHHNLQVRRKLMKQGRSSTF